MNRGVGWGVAYHLSLHLVGKLGEYEFDVQYLLGDIRICGGDLHSADWYSHDVRGVLQMNQLSSEEISPVGQILQLPTAKDS